jgi:fructosamine-3-kinase
MYVSKQTEDFLKQKLSGEINSPVSSLSFYSAGGGSINQAYRISTNQQQNFFLKINDKDRFPGLFEKEKNGLQFLAGNDCINTPSVIFSDIFNNDQFLLLEWIPSGHRSENFWKQFGENLARLHQCTNDWFGLQEDNYMGALPQQNNFTESWNEFFVRYRLEPQIKHAIQKKLLSAKHIDSFHQLFKKINTIFSDEKPSLLHGDLWSGNFMCNEKSEPVLIDPAVYFGHRSMDLAMTTLFGGFDKIFYSSYYHHFPFPPGHKEQWEICNLYPLLIHLNLFGSGYLDEIETILKRFS